ncbi:MAG: GspH/FimT family pseudopilin [Dethiobacteria bacterium]|nr:GspH/FimT family pseudopilin [Dethiobacteria bacterium]
MQKGLTLVELIIVIAILAILSAIAVPQMGVMVDAYRLNGAVRLVWSDLQNAKMTAVKENRSVRVNFTTPSYNFVRVDTSAVIFTRNLSSDYPNVTFSSSGGSTTFNSRGMADPTTITVGLSSKQKQFTIAWTGRIGNIQ